MKAIPLLLRTMSTPPPQHRFYHSGLVPPFSSSSLHNIDTNRSLLLPRSYLDDNGHMCCSSPFCQSSIITESQKFYDDCIDEMVESSLMWYRNVNWKSFLSKLIISIPNNEMVITVYDRLMKVISQDIPQSI